MVHQLNIQLRHHLRGVIISISLKLHSIVVEDFINVQYFDKKLISLINTHGKLWCGHTYCYIN